VPRHLATFRFYGELNDFLAPGAQGRDQAYRFGGAPAAKDAIEAQGVPHPEVELILADGVPVGFHHGLRGGQRIAVYPPFTRLDLGAVLRVGPPPRHPRRFVVDANLGRLARWLRLLGFDTLYRNDFADAEVVRLGAEQDRIVLTRDRRLLHHAAVAHGYWVRAVDPQAQVAEVVRRFDLQDVAAPFRRCLACNGRIRPVAKDGVRGLVPPRTWRYHDEFFRCDVCGKAYWRGAHFPRLDRTLQRFMAASDSGSTPPGSPEESAR
jgi:uncharacterized protein